MVFVEAGSYSELSQKSMMNFFAKVVNGFQLVYELFLQK